MIPLSITATPAAIITDALQKIRAELQHDRECHKKPTEFDRTINFDQH